MQARKRAGNNVEVESGVRTTVFVELPVVHGASMQEQRLFLTQGWMWLVSLALQEAHQHSLFRHIGAPEMC